MEIVYINEDLEDSRAMFFVNDKREYFYQHFDYLPCSISSPIIWEDQAIHLDSVFDITNSGDLSVNEDIAMLFMSYDPYGITAIPNKLICYDKESNERRYIITINNIIDVIDRKRSIIQEEEYGYDPNQHGYDVSIEDRKNITMYFLEALFIDKEKLLNYPENKRHIFRVKDTDVYFFSTDILNGLFDLAKKERANGLSVMKFNIENDELPTQMNI